MNLAPIAGLLERRIGLDAASLGPTAFPRAVGERMRVLDLTDPIVYAARLEDDLQEFDALTDQLVVPETWFFRGPGLFEVLARHAASVREAFPARRPFRVLSLPCGSGEEPFSLAIAFLEANLPSERWTIDGIDLSPRLIEAARRGVYRPLSFRQTHPGPGHPPERVARYFRPVADAWELGPDVRKMVRFRVGNLVGPALLPEDFAAFDLILCRNVLIYLTADARRRALDNLERLLAPAGVLGVGPAEPQMLAGRSFTRLGSEQHFLFRLGPAPTSRPASSAPMLSAAVSRPALAGGPRAGGGAPVPPPVPAPVLSEDVLARARLLADAGRLEDALAECRTHLERAGPSADGYSLLGVIEQARGDRDAATDAFRRALYLDPNHREALTHAMLLAGGRGDANRAAALRERLARRGGVP